MARLGLSASMAELREAVGAAVSRALPGVLIAGQARVIVESKALKLLRVEARQPPLTAFG